MTKADVLKSRMTGNCHVRFGSGGWGREAPADHNWAATTHHNHKFVSGLGESLASVSGYANLLGNDVLLF